MLYQIQHNQLRIHCLAFLTFWDSSVTDESPESDLDFEDLVLL